MKALRNYIKNLNTPPGPPTQQGIYASPEWTGQPYPSIDWEAITQNQEPPEGWPRPPKFNEPGDVPGPPVQFGDPITPETVEAGFNYIDNGIEEKNIYYYHPDHLGSSSHITDINGDLSQHTEFMAFGEILFDEHSVSVTQPYLFNGKELDSETGLYYYGARYYDPKTSIFINVDPLAEELPFASPYAFVLNNPVVLIDPNGQYPIYFITRSYAPFKTFGPKNKWHGDNRGHSIDRYASYRGRVIITHDTELKTTYADGGRSHSYTTDGKKDAYSNTIAHNRSKGSNIDVHSVAGNAAQIGAQPIDQFTKFTVNVEGNIKKDHILSITGVISGDDFPNQESLIYDAKGNTLWLGNFETSGDRNSGPVWNLFFENENDVHINVDIRIKVNKYGVFQGVMQKMVKKQ